MAIRHEDGSVTLTEEEFTACAHHLEMSPARLFNFLAEHPGGGTKEELLETVLQAIELANFEPGTPAN